VKEDTSKIYEFDKDGKIEELNLKLPEGKKYIPIPEEQLAMVRNMNRSQRRAWAAQQRKRK
jgi:hypothetical protein